MIRIVPLALLCAASFLAVHAALAPVDPKVAARMAASEADDPLSISAEAAEPSAASEAAAPLLLPGTLRNVTPPTMTAAPTPRKPPLRLAAAAAPVSAPASAPAPPTKRLFNPIVVSAGTLKSGSVEIHLAAIQPTDPGRQCGTGATAWPCGRLAQTGLESFIHGRAIECAVSGAKAAIPDPAHCTVGGDDIAEWLVTQGWAEPAGDTYADAAKKARDGKRGLFAAARPDAQPAEVATTR